MNDISVWYCERCGKPLNYNPLRGGHSLCIGCTIQLRFGPSFSPTSQLDLDFHIKGVLDVSDRSAE